MADDRPTAVYEFRDAHGALLYVGISTNPSQRWEQHATDKEWWVEVATKAVIGVFPRDRALVMEKAIIKAERPKFNIVHNRDCVEIESRPRQPRLVQRYPWVCSDDFDYLWIGSLLAEQGIDEHSTYRQARRALAEMGMKYLARDVRRAMFLLKEFRGDFLDWADDIALPILRDESCYFVRDEDREVVLCPV